LSVAGAKKSKFSTSAIAGTAAGGGVVVIAFISLGLFALRQKRRNQELEVKANPFGRITIEAGLAISFMPLALPLNNL
jgi:amino acid transporter